MSGFIGTRTEAEKDSVKPVVIVHMPEGANDPRDILLPYSDEYKRVQRFLPEAVPDTFFNAVSEVRTLFLTYVPLDPWSREGGAYSFTTTSYGMRDGNIVIGPWERAE